MEPGTELDFKIIKMSPEEKKVGLSIRAAGEEASRTEVDSYKQPSSSTGSTIGEVVNWKRENAEFVQHSFVWGSFVWSSFGGAGALPRQGRRSRVSGRPPEPA